MFCVFLGGIKEQPSLNLSFDLYRQNLKFHRSPRNLLFLSLLLIEIEKKKRQILRYETSCFPCYDTHLILPKTVLANYAIFYCTKATAFQFHNPLSSIYITLHNKKVKRQIISTESSISWRPRCQGNTLGA